MKTQNSDSTKIRRNHKLYTKKNGMKFEIIDYIQTQLYSSFLVMRIPVKLPSEFSFSL